MCVCAEWSPDLDVELIAPSGSVVATSGCAGQAPAPAVAGEDINLGCGIDTNGLYLFARGRQETLRALPSCPASGDCTYRWNATVTAAVHQLATHAPVAGATVIGTWTGLTITTRTGTATAPRSP